MERLQRVFQASQGPEPGQDNPTADNSEMVYISSLSLLKVLKILQLWSTTHTCANMRQRLASDVDQQLIHFPPLMSK